MMLAAHVAQAAAYAIALFIATQWFGHDPEAMFVQAISLGLFWGALIDLVKSVMHGDVRG